MVNLTDLTDALADVRRAVAAGAGAEAVAAVAGDYGLNPALLARKLVERFGADWAAAIRTAATADIESAAKAAEEAAVRRAEAAARKARLDAELARAASAYAARRPRREAEFDRLLSDLVRAFAPSRRA